MAPRQSGLPPLSQPLQNHFRGVKKSITALTPTGDTECNPFLIATPSSKSLPTRSSTTSTTTATTTTSNQDYIQPSTSKHPLRGSRKLALSDHHSTLLSLHSAVEHALIVHLATSGGNAADSSSSATSRIQLPNVITFATLRPIVERSCGRRLGPTELARLMWLWGNDDDEKSPGCNIGFHVSRGKTMDRAGNKSYDYYLSLQVGVDLAGDDEELDDEEGEEGEEKGWAFTGNRKRIPSVDGGILPSTPPRKRARPLDLPEEPKTPSPSPRSINTFARQPHLPTPPSSPSMNGTPIRRSPFKRQRTSSANGEAVLSSSPSRRLGLVRGSLGLVATWNSGIGSRKREVRKRLIKWTVDCYETWMREEKTNLAKDSNGERSDVKVKEERPSTPPPTIRRAVEGQGGILTPSATREEDWIPSKNRYKDFFSMEDEDEKIVNRSILIREWDPAFPLNKVAPTPEAELPENPTLPSSQQRTHLSAKARSVAAAQRIDPRTAVQSSSTTSKTTSTKGMTLTERIKAKEEAKRSQLEARARLGAEWNSGSTPDEAQCRSSIMASLKRKSTLSRLQDVAESVYMLFTSSAKTTTMAAPTTNFHTRDGSNFIEDGGSGGGGAAATAAAALVTKRYPHLPINDVAKTICTSSKVAMSEVEARQSLSILGDLAPGFLEINKVGAREWIRMGTTIQGEQVELKSGGVLGAVRRRIRVEMDRV